MRPTLYRGCCYFKKVRVRPVEAQLTISYACYTENVRLGVRGGHATLKSVLDDRLQQDVTPVDDRCAAAAPQRAQGTAVLESIVAFDGPCNVRE